MKLCLAVGVMPSPRGPLTHAVSAGYKRSPAVHNLHSGASSGSFQVDDARAQTVCGGITCTQPEDARAQTVHHLH